MLHSDWEVGGPMFTSEPGPLCCWECTRGSVLRLPGGLGEYVACPPRQLDGPLLRGQTAGYDRESFPHFSACNVRSRIVRSERLGDPKTEPPQPMKFVDFQRSCRPVAVSFGIGYKRNAPRSIRDIRHGRSARKRTHCSCSLSSF